MTKSEIIKIFVVVAIFAAVLAILISLCIIDAGQAIESTILFVLVLVTVIYAKRTSEIAKATKEQANEMKEQRYNSVRPAIDIERREVNRIREALAAKDEEFTYGIPCVLSNVGAGPATDVSAFIQIIDEPQLQVFGTIVAGIPPVETPTEISHLAIQQRGSINELVVYYKDVYGRHFESTREVGVDKKAEGWILGPLKIREITENEFLKMTSPIL